MPVYMVAHSHIDAAWLWRLEETVEVCKDSFLKVLDLIDKHEAVKYVQSSILYYKWMQLKHPKIFEKIKKAIKDGKWEVVLPWVEFDTNIPLGESLVRQFLHAKIYCKDFLGVEPKVVWLPDTFGFAWTLPSIMAGFGLKYFLTQKLRWNDAVLYPFHYFIWEGPDGSRILAHQMVGDYGGFPSEEAIEKEIELIKNRQGLDVIYFIYGYGDHGGGIDEEMAEAVDRLASKGKAIPALPSEFFEKIEEIKDLPVWRNELYLQYHRGCLVTQAEFKRNHRIAEVKLLDAEKLATIAEWLGGKYPLNDLRSLWEELLTLQFHDIIAGSSIEEVYKDAGKTLSAINAKIREIIDFSIRAIVEKTPIDEDKIFVFNTLPWRRNAIIELSDKEIIVAESLPPLGYKIVEKTSGGRIGFKELDDRIMLGNEFFEAVISKETGSVISFKREGFEYINAKEGGVYVQILNDTPVWGRKALESGYDAILFDAWELFHLQQPNGVVKTCLLKPESIKVIAVKPNYARVKAVYKYRQEGREDSYFYITYSVYSGIPWLEMKFEIDWHAAHRVAKLYIPLSYYADKMVFDQPYGLIERRNPGSPNATLYDKAKWEAPGQMWVYAPALENRGLAVFDDGKYGYDFGGKYLRISLIRAARYPPPYEGDGDGDFTDQGRHVFRIGLYGKPAKSSMLDVVRRAYEFNFPPIVKMSIGKGYGQLPSEFSFVEVDGNVILTVLKRGEKEGYVLRLYEVEGRDQEVKINPHLPIKKAYKAKLDEEKVEQLSIENGWIKLKVKPHEIATIAML